MIKAAIDLGTVTSRLMVAEVAGGRVEVLERSIVITDLGEGLASNSVISDTAYARLLGALLQFRELITDVKTRLACEGKEAGDIPLTIVTTSAMRDASNAGDILSGLSDLGFDVEVISGSREAELSFKGTLSGFSDLIGTVMVVDVGGGSTELALGTGTPRPSIITSHSFDIGSRRVTELFLRSDPPSDAEMDEARQWVSDQTEGFIGSLPQTPSEVIAIAGTATSAVTIRDGISTYDSALVHGRRVTADEIGALIDALSSMDLEERRNVVGLHPGRAPVIIGGLITLAALLKGLRRESLLVSDTDILQGIVLGNDD